ncbi:hypothetical protein HAX54_039392 [Datura stramonium]|uniref:Uncharacterized protein n=1 Tax=Datura stramonium TaxID=4076 RepID=A0ABS8SIW7_DATST|nr:hypothetical protein [Datura stramonium]
MMNPPNISPSSSVPEILSFLKKKSSFQDKDLSFVQRILLGREKNFKIELENVMKKSEEEKRRMEETYKRILADRLEDHKEKTQLLYERINELKKEGSEAGDKIRAYYEEKFKELNGRVSRLEEEMGKNDGLFDFHEVQVSSAENCSGKSRNEGIDNINLVPTEKSCPRDQSLQYAPSVCASAKADSNCNEQKESDHSDVADLEVETALQASGATGINLKINTLESSQGKDGVIDSHEVHLSRDPKSVCTSTGNSSGQSRHKGIDNINLVPTKKNCPGDQSFQCAPSACDSAQVESNSDKQKGSDHSEEAEPLPINLASECGDPTRNPLACEVVDRFKNNLNAVSDKPESSPVILFSESDDEMACASNRCGLGGNLTSCPQIKEVHAQDSSISTRKRKRSTNESENSDGSSFGRQMKVLTQEIVNGEKRFFAGDDSTNPECSSKTARVVPCPEKNSVFIRRCEDKDGVKYHSELPPRRSDKPNGFSNGNDSDLDNDSCSIKKIETFIKEGRKWLSEDDLCSAFEKDPELCWNAVCALYRQQISENKSSYSMSHIDEMSITTLGKYLTDGDSENKLSRTMSEVSLEYHRKCKRLAIRYCHQLFKIYHSKKDRLFCPAAGIL